MYLNQTDLANLKIRFQGDQQTSDILFHLIEKNEVENATMKEGVRYYRTKHDIMDREIKYWTGSAYVEDKHRSNNKLIHPFHRNQVDQKIDKILGEEPTLTTDSEEQLKATKEVLGDKFGSKLQKWAKRASNKGVEWIHPFIDSEPNAEGKFDFHWVVDRAEGIIPIYDERFEDRLLEVIRYFRVTKISTAGDGDGSQKNEELHIWKVEWWNADTVTFYVQMEGKKRFVMDESKEQNPMFHITQGEENKGWGRVPFIPLKNNHELITDLEPIKSLIDNYDRSTSDTANDLDDIQNLIWKLKGYEGTDLKKFMEDLKVFKAIKLDVDGDAQAESADLPMDARDAHMNRLETDINLFGRGVNNRSDIIGNNPSGAALRFLYAWLDLKCKDMKTGLLAALDELYWFANEFLKLNGIGNDWNPKDIKTIFNESIIINESELIENLKNSREAKLIDEETAVAKHPYVTDPKSVVKKLKAERKAQGAGLLTGDVVENI